MRNKYHNYANDLSNAGYKIIFTQSNGLSFELSESEVSYILSILGLKYYALELYLSGKRFLQEKITKIIEKKA